MASREPILLVHGGARAISQGRAAARRPLQEFGNSGGAGGFIAADANGNVALPFNPPNMYRGIARGGRISAAMFGDDTLDA
jgi:isoaspartyl peptidase/L-asparaginase-like protein (Ntn-hydrolase superfamily)